ncbi:hydroxycarboxylic acid receptor 2-like [Engraulis encrasicolus]|uniref:hydroxycarboxylic acid receptor 2-like n=1 Tax=Engraulis encrasicolus TaxID=184585 RepID=UPI002FD49A29
MEGNATSSSRTCCPFTTTAVDGILPPILILEFVFGLLGNGLALWMLAFHVSSWKPHSMYLLHLTVADTIVLFCLPFRADYYLRHKDWRFGDAMCRILMFLLAANRTAGIFFLTAVAVDRYLKVVYPRSRLSRLGLGWASLISCCIWAAILAMTVYLLTVSHIEELEGHRQCESFQICLDFRWDSIWHETLYLLQFLVPTVIICFCTACIAHQLRTRTVDTGGRIRRAVYLVLAVATVFILCFLPSTACRLAVIVLKTQYSECVYFEPTNLAFYTSVCLTYFNSVLNPVVYYLSSPAISRTLQQLWNKLLPVGKRRPPPPPPPSSGVYTVSRPM